MNYEGTGVYWLDRLEEGVWRLEVMPDAVQVSDPFTRPSLDKEVMRIVSGAWDMTLNLPDLGKQFRVNGLNNGNTFSTQAANGKISILPQKGGHAARLVGGEDAGGLHRHHDAWVCVNDLHGASLPYHSSSIPYPTTSRLRLQESPFHLPSGVL